MSKGLVVVLCCVSICVCVAFCVYAKQPANATGCCGQCDCAKAWVKQGQINTAVVEHLRRNGVVIGSPAPVGSAK